jgi:hypothetical protein
MSEPPKCLQMLDYIKVMQDQECPSMNFLDAFTFHDSPTPFHLANAKSQKSLHHELSEEGFDSSRFPFSLQKWDDKTERWNLLTIDCQLMAVNFLVYLDKNMISFLKNRDDKQLDFKTSFEDTVHTHQKLDFKTRFVDHEGPLYIEVTPVLKEQGKKDVHLKLTITNEVRFDNLKITTPATMVTASPDFECCICFDGVNNEKIFQTGCGPGHCFHTMCIDQWFATGRSSCPVCRTTMRYK